MTIRKSLKQFIENNGRYKYQNLNRWEHYNKLEEWWQDNNIPETWSNKRRVYHFLNDLPSIPKCKNCSNPTGWDEGYFRYREYCSIKCAQSTPEVRKKIEQTIKKKYNITNPGQLNINHAKRHPPNNTDGKIKCRMGCGKPARYWTFNLNDQQWRGRCSKDYRDCPGYGEKIASKLVGKKRQGEPFKNKGEICDYGCGQLAHYKLKTKGYNNYKLCCSPAYSKCPASQQRSSELRKKKYADKKTRMDVYGRMVKTRIQRYGKECWKPGGELYEKFVKTMKDKYGVTHYAKTDEFRTIVQSPEHLIKTIKGSLHKKEYTLPSGKTIIVQGYEPQTIDLLLQTYNEEDIVFGSDVPQFSYFDGRHRKYNPDMFIPKENLIIEVKTEWTYNIRLKRNKLKKKAVLEAGYNFKFFIWSDDRKRLVKEDEVKILDRDFDEELIPDYLIDKI